MPEIREFVAGVAIGVILASIGVILAHTLFFIAIMFF
jgi:hypothetical protein